MGGPLSGTANKKPIYGEARESEEGGLNFVARINERAFGSAESWAKGKNLSLLVQSSYNAFAKLNKLVERKNVAALIHTTC